MYNLRLLYQFENITKKNEQKSDFFHFSCSVFEVHVSIYTIYNFVKCFFKKGIIMKKLVFLSILFLTFVNVFANWEHRFVGSVVSGVVTNSDKIYFSRNNGLSEYNQTDNSFKHFTMLNSELPSNVINSFLKISDNTHLISTKGGLCLLTNGLISNNNSICLDYPEKDARKLYLDSKNRIWTYSANKVHCYDNDEWFTVDLTDSVFYPFDIWDITFIGDDVWVMFNDNRVTNTKFYENAIVDLRINVAVIQNLIITKLLDTKEEFPKRQGGYSVCDAGDFILWKNTTAVYKYENDVWTPTEELHYNGIKPFWYQNLILDHNGLIWYTVGNDDDKVAFPVSYNPQTGEKTAYLQNEDEKWITTVYLMDNKQILAKSTDVNYLLTETGWIKYTKSDLGLVPTSSFGYPRVIGDKVYVQVYRSSLPDGSYICLEDGSTIEQFYQGLPYSNLTQVEINKDGKGIFRGDNFNRDLYRYQADSAFVNLKAIVNSSNPDVKPVSDGNIYFSNCKVDNTLKSNLLTTWKGNELVKIDMGFGNKEQLTLNTFDTYGDLLIGIGGYNIAEDSLNSFLSIYNLKDKTLKTYDKNNSDMPDYYIEILDIFYFYRDTIPSGITIDKNLDPWILTSMSLMKFKESGSEIIDISDIKFGVSKISYDQFSNEIILLSSRSEPLYYINAETFQIGYFDITSNGIVGNLVKVKKLLDDNLWAADDLGYLYQYTGKGIFKIFDLQISNRQNLKFPINDFSIDINKNLHLASEIGLLSNSTILSGTSVQESNENIWFDISPNPSADFITIQFQTSEVLKTSEVYRVQIFNVLGIEVMSVETRHAVSLQRIDISHLPAGVYFIRIGDKVEKFVKM